MGRFSDILMTVDFDRTLTDRNSLIPEKNIAAIKYFISEGGLFTMNTGRSVPMFSKYIPLVPVNAPMIMYNGAALYDKKLNKITEAAEIPGGKKIIKKIMGKYPWLMAEVQGEKYHYFFEDEPLRTKLMTDIGAPFKNIEPDETPEPVIKVAFFGSFKDASIAQFYSGSESEINYFESAEAELRAEYGDRLEVIRPAARIIDIQRRGCSKGKAARELAEKMHRNILVCAGDAENDLSMLEKADYAFIPSDCSEAIKGRGFRETLPCGEGCIYGAVQELKKIF